MNKECLQCGGEVPSRDKKAKFCNSSCSAKYNNPKRAKFHECGYCKKNFKRQNSGQKFCSIPCSSEYSWENRVKPKIIEGKIANRRTLKNYLIREHKNRCSICFIEEWQGEPIIFEVDHVNGDPSNNYPWNLRLLCPNCHSQTEFFCGRNFGNGRGSRGLSIS